MRHTIIYTPAATDLQPSDRMARVSTVAVVVPAACTVELCVRVCKCTGDSYHKLQNTTTKHNEHAAGCSSKD